MHEMDQSKSRIVRLQGTVSARSRLGPTAVGKRGKEKINTYLRLNDFKIAYLNPTSREVRDLKLDLNRPLALATAGDAAHASAKATHHAATFVIVAANRRQAKFSAHQELFAATELLDFPDDGRSFRGIVDGTNVCAEAWGVGVVGDGDDDGDVVGSAAAFELRFCLS